jgi:hypothetical protein
MAKFFVIDKCFVGGTLFYGDEVVDLAASQVEEIREKGMTHHFRPLDAKDAWETKSKVDINQDLEKKKIEDLRGLALELNIPYEGLKKDELIAAIRERKA